MQVRLAPTGTLRFFGGIAQPGLVKRPCVLPPAAPEIVPKWLRLERELVARDRARLEAAGFTSWLEVPGDPPLMRPFPPGDLPLQED